MSADSYIREGAPVSEPQPFTAAQEARIREIVREEIGEDHARSTISMAPGEVVRLQLPMDLAAVLREHHHLVRALGPAGGEDG